jgi:hypothetical protein
VFGQNVTEHNPAPSPSGHPLLSGPPTLNDIHQIFTEHTGVTSLQQRVRQRARVARFRG